MAEEAHNKYKVNVLNPFMENLVVEILSHRPKDVLRHSLKYLLKQRGDDISISEKQELMMLRAEAANLKESKKDEDSGSEASYESEEDDYIDDLPDLAKAYRPWRNSVSEESFGSWNKQEAFQARFIPKSEDKISSISERLNRCFMFTALDDEELNIVIGAMEERKVSAGNNVITQGEDGQELFVVDSGKLSCYKQFPGEEEEKYLKDYRSGEAFGELALLYNAPRAATIKAKTDAVLWVLDRGTFKHIVKDSARKKREQYEDFLSQVDLFEDIDPYERSQIADAFKPVNFKNGDYVIREGDWGDIFYFITNGEAVATKILTPGTAPETVKEYMVGDYFGELALLRGEPRAANIVAEGPLDCVTLDRHAFKRMLGPLEEILQRNASKYEEILKNFNPESVPARKHRRKPSGVQFADRAEGSDLVVVHQISQEVEDEQLETRPTPNIPLSAELSAKVLSIFQKIDVDNSKTIDREETIKWWDTNFAKINTKALFDTVDVNGDGKITEEEWVEFWVAVRQTTDEEEIDEELENLLEKGSWTTFEVPGLGKIESMSRPH